MSLSMWEAGWSTDLVNANNVEIKYKLDSSWTTSYIDYTVIHLHNTAVTL